MNGLIDSFLNYFINKDSFEPIINFNVMTLGFIISIGISLFFNRSISKKSVFFSSIVGFFYSEINHFIYSFYEGTSGFSNPQISTVVILSFILIYLTIMCCFKKTRTMDRIFVSLSIAIIMFLFLLIHTAVVNIGAIQGIKDINKRNEINISMIVDRNDMDEFYRYCTLNKLICDGSFHRNKNEEEVKIFDYYDQIEGAGFSSLKGQKINRYLPGNENIMSRSYLNLMNGEYEHSFIVVLNKKEKYTALAYDIESVQYIHGKYVVIFYTWYGIALLFWVYGFLGLLMFHKFKFKKRLKKK